MTGHVVQSFCERCGTRFTSEAPAAEAPTGGGVLGRFRRRGTESAAVAGAAAELPISAAFADTFRFCLECRRYNCTACWNEAAGRCLSCRPVGAVESSAPIEPLPVPRPESRPPAARAPLPSPIPPAPAPQAIAPVAAPLALQPDAGWPSGDRGVRPDTPPVTDTGWPPSLAGPVPAAALPEPAAAPPEPAEGSPPAAVLDPWRGVVFSAPDSSPETPESGPARVSALPPPMPMPGGSPTNPLMSILDDQPAVDAADWARASGTISGIGGMARTSQTPSKPDEPSVDGPAEQEARLPALEAADLPAQEAEDRPAQDAEDRPAQDAEDRPAQDAAGLPVLEAEAWDVALTDAPMPIVAEALDPATSAGVVADVAPGPGSAESTLADQLASPEAAAVPPFEPALVEPAPAELPAAVLPTGELSAAELSAAELSAAELPVPLDALVVAEAASLADVLMPEVGADQVPRDIEPIPAVPASDTVLRVPSGPPVVLAETATPAPLPHAAPSVLRPIQPPPPPAGWVPPPPAGWAPPSPDLPFGQPYQPTPPTTGPMYMVPPSPAADIGPGLTPAGGSTTLRPPTAPGPYALAQEPGSPSAAPRPPMPLPMPPAGQYTAAAPVPPHGVTGTRVCPHCGLPLSARARFCRRCGTPQGT